MKQFFLVLLLLNCTCHEKKSIPQNLYGIYELRYADFNLDQREFTIDHTYIRSEYYNNSLFRQEKGTWELDKDTIKVQSLLVTDFHKEWDTIFTPPESVSVTIPLKNNWNKDTIKQLEMFRWADNNFPAEWETWKKVF